MKKTIFTINLLFCSILLFSQMTVNISGQITELNSNTPIANHTVHIIADSVMVPGGGIWFYINTVTTNNSGHYSDVVTVPFTAQILFYIHTFDCNNVLHGSTGVSTNSPIVANFSICNGGTPPCSAGFFQYPDSLNPLKYYFIDNSTGNPASWQWDFGDGSFSNLQNPDHTYLTAGTYNVTLIISSGFLCSDTITNSITVGGLPCTGNFTYNVSNFTSSFSAYANLPSPTFTWNFGDGSTGTGQTTSHTYLNSGQYVVTLTVADPSVNCIFTTTQTVNIASSTSCTAMYMVYPDSVNPLTLHFIDQSAGSPTNWQWSFGDGSSSTSQNPTHTYAQPGYYLVCLSIFSNSPASSCQDTYCDTIHVGGTSPCTSYFTHTANNLIVNFAGSSSLPSPGFQWDFGDGSVGTGQNPTHTYNQAGSYNVCVVASGAGMMCTPYCQNITVTSPGYFGSLHGHVNCANNFADHGVVYLIEFNPVTNILTAIDTTDIDSGGYYGFSNVPYGSYLVKAALKPISTYYSNYLPTYHTSVLYWNQATNVALTAAGAMANINMIAGVNPGGPGFIGGNVTQGANKLLGSGDPIPNVEILLLDNNDNPVAYTYSDMYGDYEFSNLAYGTYKVYAEIIDKTTYPILVTLDANNQTVDNVSIIVNSDDIVASIENDDFEIFSEISEVYPNPNSGNININVSLLKATELTFTIYNQVGQIVEKTVKEVNAGNNTINIETNTLTEGFYYIQVSTDNEDSAVRKFVTIY